MEDILASVEKAQQVKGKPSIIIAKTTKGKGVSFMEDTCTWHGVGDESKLDAALEEVK